MFGVVYGCFVLLQLDDVVKLMSVLLSDMIVVGLLCKFWVEEISNPIQSNPINKRHNTTQHNTTQEKKREERKEKM